jgi:hypothetical protein
MQRTWGGAQPPRPGPPRGAINLATWFLGLPVGERKVDEVIRDWLDDLAEFRAAGLPGVPELPSISTSVKTWLLSNDVRVRTFAFQLLPIAK